MKPLDFRRRPSAVLDKVEAQGRRNRGLSEARLGRNPGRFAKAADDAMAENTIVDKDFDNTKIDPYELRGSVDAGRRARRGAE